MTELETTLEPQPQTATEPASGPSLAEQAATPTLITEQQVIFSTAAAVAAPVQRRLFSLHAVAAAMQGVFARPEKPRARKHYPQHIDFIEDAAMAREMRRL